MKNQSFAILRKIRIPIAMISSLLTALTFILRAAITEITYDEAFTYPAYARPLMDSLRFAWWRAFSGGACIFVCLCKFGYTGVLFLYGRCDGMAFDVGKKAAAVYTEMPAYPLAVLGIYELLKTAVRDWQESSSSFCISTKILGVVFVKRSCCEPGTGMMITILKLTFIAIRTFFRRRARRRHFLSGKNGIRIICFRNILDRRKIVMCWNKFF
ncbi:hypothetical protein [Parablautia intestinalis]|uniref:hypothetical protein n=1 Tax=Parablautia intestinalis TaxID=2320100 RepID=UPI0023CB91AC|nr:hypothetical protein [Parablautia intestinalis]MDE7047573.1 hypothetical protein [Lachnospiraceae bacterium]